MHGPPVSVRSSYDASCAVMLVVHELMPTQGGLLHAVVLGGGAADAAAMAIAIVYVESVPGVPTAAQ
jgi:hypothetical protein